MPISSLFDEDPVPLVTGSSGSLSELFSEEPVPLNVFIQDRKYLGSPPLSPIQWDAVQHAERIYLPELYPIMGTEFSDYWKTPVRMVNFINLCWGKGSGKDMIAQFCALRIVYLLLCLKSPQAYYGMPYSASINLLNVATNADQARRPFFLPMTRLVSRGWFEDKSDAKNSSIMFDKNIESISGHSEAESQEGLNLIAAVADEIDGFTTAADHTTHDKKSQRAPQNTVEHILKMMRGSAVTRFPKVHKQIRISYPRYRGSPIIRELAKSRENVERRGAASNHFFSGPWATWEVNPTKTREDFNDEYEDLGEQEAASIFECKPYYSMDPFFKDAESVEDAWAKPVVSPLSVFYRNTGSSWVPEYEFSDELYPIQGAIYAMHADLAVTGDRAGISMAHVVSYEAREMLATDAEETEHVKREFLPQVKVDFAIGLEADLKEDPPREIQIRWARELCFELQRRGFYIKSLTFDNFQSVDSMQLLKEAGIESSRVSTDLKPDIYVNLRDMVYSHRIKIPFSELLKAEILGLQRKTNGKIDHTPVGSKDISDSVACAVIGAILAGGSEAANGARAFYGPARFGSGEAMALPEQYKGVSLEDVMTPGVDPFMDFNPMGYWGQGV